MVYGLTWKVCNQRCALLSVIVSWGRNIFSVLWRWYLSQSGSLWHEANSRPVPAGKYWIVDRPEGGLRSQVNAGIRDLYNHVVNGATFRHNEWFALWRDDWGIDDYTWIEGVKRGNFRLHPGTLSEGCITLPHDSDFAMLRNALLITQRVDVPCMSKLKAYGTIEVIANGKTCP